MEDKVGFVVEGGTDVKTGTGGSEGAGGAGAASCDGTFCS